MAGSAACTFIGMVPAPMSISLARPDRQSALAAVLGRAFVNEPMMVWPMGRTDDVVGQFTQCFSVFLDVALELGIVWELDNEKDPETADGVAVWIPPGQLEDWSDHPWNQPGIQALTDDGGHRYGAFWGWVDDHRPAGRWWQLDSIGVDPSVQGRGYGSALIRAGQDRARADGTGVFLSTGTERNVSIYGRYGFRVAEDLDAPDGGPHIWFMRWYP
jgi:GNAT superfamily N-acetyltransferase